MTESLVEKSLPQDLNKEPSILPKKSKKNNLFTFTGIFKKFEIKHNDFGEDLFGFILEDIREIHSKALITDWQWFNMNEKFKLAFEAHKDEALSGKKIQFEGIKESHKKGYYTYQGNVLISNPEDLEHRILRPKNIKVI